MTREFPAQMASTTENNSIWWRLHVKITNKVYQPIYNNTEINDKYTDVLPQTPMIKPKVYYPLISVTTKIVIVLTQYLL